MKVLFSKKRSVTIGLLVLLALLVFAGQRKKAVDKPQPSATRRGVLGRIPVSVTTIEKAAVRDSFSTVGTVAAFREADVFAEASGVVRKVAVEPGERRSAGAPIVVLDDELSLINLRRAETLYRQLRKNAERHKALYGDGAISLSLYETVQLEADNAEADLVMQKRRHDDAVVKAPFAGVVSARFVDQGELVREGTKVAHMVDMSRVKVVLFVPEQELLKFPEGGTVSVLSDLLPGRVFAAVVHSVAPRSGRDHTCRVELLLERAEPDLFRSGMFARVVAGGQDRGEQLLVPRAALVSGSRQPVLFVVRNGKAQLCRFVAGRSLRDRIEVLGGLKAGDQVVVNGQDELRDGSPVSVVANSQPVSAER